MACYAALNSTLEQIPQPVQQITYLQCRCEVVCRLLVTLENSSLKNSLAIKDLDEQIRDASYEAQDITESHISKQLLSKSASRGVGSFFANMISGPRGSVDYLPQNVDLEFHGLEKIIDEFDSILDALSNEIKYRRAEDLQPQNSSTTKYGRAEDLQPQNSTTTAGSSSIVSSKKSTATVGLDEDLLQIKDRLTGSPSKLNIISIIEMGGIGKTTLLARNLYDDLLIEQHFDTRAWIVVSQEYHVQEMLTGLLGSTRHGGGELHQKSIQQLAEFLYKSLKGRRYLIVMDDVWDTKAWDEVKRFFPVNNNGSRIILTTRLSEVAIYANSCSPIHRMSLLSSEASWILLCEKVFGKECCSFALEEIGKKIAQNCKGLPLAIVVIGGLLSKGIKTRDYWEYIAENVKSAITGNEDQVMDILFLSYNSLSYYLRACFLYMGVFPEDKAIFVSQLIKLWIAEGFVKPLAHKSVEEVAKDYLQDLIDRNLILVNKRNHNGGIKTCRIHDLLRELCVKKAQDEKFLQIMNSDVCVFPQGRNNQRCMQECLTCINIQTLESSNFNCLSRDLLTI